MRIAYLDCFSGISGDMFLGAAVDAGVPLQTLQAVARGLGVNAELVSHRVERGGIAATKIDVLIHGRADQPLDLDTAGSHEHEHAHPHEHEAHPHEHEAHTHGHEHAHPHEHEAHSHEHGHAHQAHEPHVHRGLKEIREIIAHAPISPVAQAFALKTFELLAHAEGKVHNRDAELIHFHEVGSEDAIVDIVCSAVAIETLAVDAWYCSALNVGGGTVKCAHGVLPVPAPATAELLLGAPVFSSGIQKEMLTPTGAALLRALEVRFEPLPGMTLSATGYGAGARDLQRSANVVRLSVGESVATARPASGLPVSAPTALPTSVPTELPTSVPTGLNASAPTGLNASAPTGLNASASTGLNASAPTGLNASVPTGLNASLPTGLNASVPTGLNASVPTGLNASASTGWPTSAPASPAQMWDVDNADTVTVLEANLDDMNPQLFSYVQQKLLSAGALDAFGVPVQMKKGRPGIVFTVLAAPHNAETLARILLTETTTLGVRMRQEQRRILDREHVTVESPWGPIRVKLGRLQGEVLNCAPEFEDCRRIAEAHSVPLKTVLQEALRLYLASPAANNEIADAAKSADASKTFQS